MHLVIIYSAIYLLIDQVSKYVMMHILEVGESISVIRNLFQFTYVQNTGAAWSILEGNRLLLILASIFALILIYFLFMKGKTIRKKESLVYGMLFGGIIGNLVDRVFLGYVVDFFHFNISGYEFPIFNIADIGIVIGICLLVWIVYREENHDRDTSKRND